MKLKLKKHQVLPSAYTTLDEEYIAYKHPETNRWCWGIFVSKDNKYRKQPYEGRTLNDIKYVIQEYQDTTEQKLWEE